MVGVVHEYSMTQFTACKVISLKESELRLALVLNYPDIVTFEGTCGSVSTVDEVLM